MARRCGRDGAVPGALLVFLSACGGDRVATETRGSTGTNNLSDAGWTALAAWDALPVLDSSRASQDSSKQRSETQGVSGLIEPGNKDFNNFVAVCGGRPSVFLGDSDGAPCDPGLEGYVLASADDGPGFVSRLYFSTGTVTGSGVDKSLADERIRIYADDLSKPVFESKLSDFEMGKEPPFVPPLLSTKSSSVVSYVPISYQSKLRILLDDLRTTTTAYYYQIDRRSSGATSTFDPAALTKLEPAVVAALEASAAGTEGTTPWVDADLTLNASGTTPILDRRGAGTLRRLELTFDNPETVLGDLTLEVVWDDQASPVIDVPLSALFASDPTVTAFDTLPMSVEVRGTQAIFRFTLPMPFADHAVVSLANKGGAAHVVHAHADGLAQPPKGDWGYLHATRRESTTPVSDGHYVVGDITGPGKYVGTVARFLGQVDTNEPPPLQSPFNFLEGDDMEVADGAPATHGTGTEEYFDGAWYFDTGPFAAPFSAVTFVGAGTASGSGEITAVRWQLLGDSIAFRDSFDIGFEYGANMPASALDYASVAVYYAK